VRPLPSAWPSPEAHRGTCPVLPCSSSSRGIRASTRPGAIHLRCHRLATQMGDIPKPGRRCLLQNLTVSAPASCTFCAATLCAPLVVLLRWRSEEHTSELQSRFELVCRLLLEKKKNKKNIVIHV